MIERHPFRLDIGVPTVGEIHTVYPQTGRQYGHAIERVLLVQYPENFRHDSGRH
jgi:hypothetical protein